MNAPGTVTRRLMLGKAGTRNVKQAVAAKPARVHRNPLFIVSTLVGLVNIRESGTISSAEAWTVASRRPSSEPPLRGLVRVRPRLSHPLARARSHPESSRPAPATARIDASEGELVIRSGRKPLRSSARSNTTSCVFRLVFRLARPEKAASGGP